MAHSSKPNQVHTGTNQRCCSPAEMVLVGKCAALLGFAEILKANALCTVDGSRLS